MRRLATYCLLLAFAVAALGRADLATVGNRHLLQANPSRPGPFTGWVVPLAECPQRCPNLLLASWGLQCALGSDQCCLRKDTLCTPLALWAEEPTPATWTGLDLTVSSPPPPPPAPSPPAVVCRGGGKWQNASATQYWSYPPCCTDSTVDQTECDTYSGCQYEGLFAAFGDKKKSRAWVEQNNIASFFEVPNKQNRKNWNKKWKNKKLRIRNPITCKTLDVTILDTCDDGDCPDPTGAGPACCTAHADENGGKLVDLEYYTSVRFWGAPIGVHEVRRLEFQLISS